MTHTKQWRWILAVGMLAALAGLGGCVSPQQVQRGDGELGLANPVSGAELASLKAQPMRARVLAGPNQGRKFTGELARPDEGGQAWTRHFPELGLTKMITRGQAVLIRQENDANEDARAEYEPALNALPERLTTGRVHTGQAQMKIYSLKTGKLRHDAKCSYEVELMGTREIDLPSGRVRAYQVQQRRRLDLGVAEVRLTIDSFYVPGRGLVEKRLERRVKTLGLSTSTTHERLQYTALSDG